MTIHDTAATGVITDDSFGEENITDGSLVMKPWNPDDIRITTKAFSLRELNTQIIECELDLAPDFQRAFVWKDEQQIRLVESILLGIPLPAFYFNQDETGAHQVIDGVQRLTTIKRFMADELELTEERLEYLKALTGQTYSTLDPTIRRRFAGTQIVAHVIEPQTPDEVKYDIFSRVNTGGSDLKPQEIRHCMSKATSRDFLQRLVESEHFDQAMGDLFWSKEPSGEWVRNNRRMADREMALRFCAFYSTPIEDYALSNSLDGYLLEFNRQLDQQSRKKLEAMEAAFNQAMENCYTIFGEWAFRRWALDTDRRGPVNRAIFESQAVAMADYSIAELTPHKRAIKKEFRTLFSDPTYDNAVRFGTGAFRKVERRITMPREILARIVS